MDLATRMRLTAAPAFADGAGRRSTFTRHVGSSARRARRRAVSDPEAPHASLNGRRHRGLVHRREIEQLHEVVCRIKLDLEKADVIALVKRFGNASQTAALLRRGSRRSADAPPQNVS